MAPYPWQFVNVRNIITDDTKNAALCELLAYSMYHPTAEKIRERIASYHSSDIFVYACTDSDTYLGFIVYRLCEQTAAIVDIAVHEQARAHGIGSFLIDGLLCESNATQIIAETDDEAIGFYQKYGFKVADTKTALDRKRYVCRYVPLETKTIKRENWSRVLSSSFRFSEKTYSDFRCVVGLLTIGKVTASLKKTVFGKKLVLADNGYHWLQIAPEDEAWWLTTMLDTDGNIIQYYFDVTDRNILDGENSRFYDLYLDVVVLPDGNATILDKDELNAALKDGVITKTQYRKAMNTAERLFKEVPPRLNETNAFVSELYKEMCFYMTQEERKRLAMSYLGKTVTIQIDRPIGTVHPKHPDLIYPINYGYIPDVLGGDGEELDVYLLGVNTPQETYTAQIIGVVYRRNDVEDKLVAAPVGARFTKEDIAEAVHFQEQYYDSFVAVDK